MPSPRVALVAVQPSNDEIRAALDDVLSRSEFNPQKTFVVWLAEKLAAFFGWLGTLFDTNPVLFWILLIGCAVLLILLLVHIIWTTTRVLGIGSRLAQEDIHESRTRLSKAYAEEARHRAAAADYTEAIRFLFLSLIYRFDEAGKVSFRRAYTNREYLELFADRRPVYAGLSTFVDTLDENWYGQHATGQQRYEDCAALYERLK
jgi:hypothetical protein